MRDAGMTLLFVSHSVDRVNALCDRALLLEEGRRQFFGEAATATDLYLKAVRTEEIDKQPAQERDAEDKKPIESPNIKRQTRGLDRYGSQEVRITSVEFHDESGAIVEEYHPGDEIRLSVSYVSDVEAEDLNVSFFVRDETGVNLCGTMTWDEGVELPSAKEGDRGRVRFRFVNRLRPGRFGVCVALTRINREDRRKPLLYDQVDGVASFASQWNEDRPIHYKFDAQIDVEIERAP
jgi:lipopolysaccharide transport system ATP-binding protein